MTLSRAAALAQELRSSVEDERVLGAVASLPRDRFVPEAEREHAYDNVALPIGAGQTISQPLVVARMLELLELRPGDRVLDVGTGSGYHAALLARLCRHVWTIERHAELSRQAAAATRELGIENVTFVLGDGSAGLPAEAPFDAINVAAAAEELPAALVHQLAVGGRLVVPVGDTRQHLMRIRRTERGLMSEQHEAVRFVPLVRPRSGPWSR